MRVLALALSLLAAGGLLLACSDESGPGAASDFEACDGGACEEDAAPRVATPPSDAGSRPGSDGGRDAAALAPCDDGGLPGMLDPGFGSGGFVSIRANPGGNSFARAVVVLPDGKTILAGSLVGPGPTRFGLVRLTASGVLDTGFGKGGIVDTALPFSGSSGAMAVALAADGRILAAGVAGQSSGADFAIARYSPGGALDGTFGDGGLALGGFPSPNGYVYAIAVLPDGKLLVAGTMGPDNPKVIAYYAVARFNSNGSLDTTFGSGGNSMVRVGSSGHPAAITLQPDGKILVVGASYAESAPSLYPQVSAMRLDADGSLDPSFGVSGRLVLVLGKGSSANAVAVDGAGRIVLGGYIEDDFAVLRLTPSGALDATFGSAGIVRADLGVSGGIGALAIQPDGKHLVAGGSKVVNPEDYRHGFARFQPGGAPDPGFGTAGRAVTVVAPPGGLFEANHVAIGGGRATFAGHQWGSFGIDMAVVRHCL